MIFLSYKTSLQFQDTTALNFLNYHFISVVCVKGHITGLNTFLEGFIKKKENSSLSDFHKGNSECCHLINVPMDKQLH